MDNHKVELCARDVCTGCEACRSICPKDCITMTGDSEGFLYPTIDQSKCLRCNRCRDICPLLSEAPSCFQREENPKTYACWINDNEVRLRSSSGGLFSAIAMNVLEDGGVVFGAAFDENMHLRHIGLENTAELDKLRRSKYIQSEISDSYKLVKKHLELGRRVLFVGAPCQVAGLNIYLGKDDENLLTADFICHGVPSPGVFSEYVKYLETIFRKRLVDINFRDKRKGWSNSYYAIGSFDKEKEVMLSGRNNGYMYGFSRHYFLRKSCHCCAFKKMPRCGDFTIADFWGIQDNYPEEAYKGISCLLINSSKGDEYLTRLSPKVCFFKESFSKAKKGNKNLFRSAPIPPERTMFFEDFNKNPFATIMKRYLTPSLKIRVRGFIKCRMNLHTILFIQKIKSLRRTK